MVDYYSIGRTNYFAVKNIEIFKQDLESLREYLNSGFEIIEDQKEDQIVFCLTFEDGIPSYYYNAETGEEFDVEFTDILSTHLADDWVCIIMETGSESLRFLSGYSVAFNNKGEQKYVALESIYDLSKELGKNITDCSY